MLTSRSLARCLLFLSVNAVLLSGANARPHEDLSLALPFPTPPPLFPRQGIFGGGSDTGTSTTTSTSSTSATSTSTSTTDSSTSTSTSTSSSTSSTSDTSTSSTSTDTSTSTSTSDTSTSSTSTPPPTSPPTSPSVSASVSTAADGAMTTVFVTQSATSSSPTNSSAPETNGDDKSGGGISQSTIIGLSVSGGVALIGVIAFVVWKFTRKRFADDDFDNEAIKWPELNAHGDDIAHGALPANRTGGAGFETSSQVNLAVPRPDSRTGSVAASAGSSVDLYNPHDPYAVPPLPHLNPNMPYRDDPSQVYYDTDPYAPVPPPQGEAIPMTQINRTRSPGPAMAYGYDGRASPAPTQLTAQQMDYRARSPGPAASLYAGRAASPGPQAGRMSPGPQMAYGHGPAPGY